MKGSLACILLLSLFAGGCSTISTKATGSIGKPYSGLSCDLRSLQALPQQTHSWPMVVALTVDAPLSALADTVLLPVDLLAKSPDGAPACSWWAALQ